MNRVTAEQVRRNAASRDLWDSYASHRKKVSQYLTGESKECEGRLCVFGAGNSNDLELPELVRLYREIHLVDLDADALAQGIARQIPSGTQHDAEFGTIVAHGGFDATGIVEQLEEWSPESEPEEAIFQACLRSATKGPAASLPRPFEVVASVCLLTQLVESVALALGERHGRFLDLVFAVRNRHLALLAELLAPGGRGVLVTDIVSSDTYPDLAKVPEGQLVHTLKQLIADHNFFTGANPLVLEAFFRTDPDVSPQVENVRLSQPWLWTLGKRTYAVAAITFQKVAGEGE